MVTAPIVSSSLTFFQRILCQCLKHRISEAFLHPDLLLRLPVDEAGDAGDTLHTATSSETANEGLGDASDVVVDASVRRLRTYLANPLCSAPAKTLAS